jgi:ParB family transcriptional regulator, chromosome partitioning protein
MMEIDNLPIEALVEADWNANQVDDAVLARLRTSIKRYGLVQNLVIRPLGDHYEVLSGNQRLRLLREMDIKTIPCVVVNVDDDQARLLSQALNRIHGEDDLGLRAEIMREILRTIPEDEVLALLPGTLEGLKGLASLGQEAMAAHLRNWEQVRAVRLRHLQFKLTAEQLETVEAAIAQVLPEAKKVRGNSPNTRGTALYMISKSFIGKEETNGK